MPGLQFMRAFFSTDGGENRTRTYISREPLYRHLLRRFTFLFHPNYFRISFCVTHIVKPQIAPATPGKQPRKKDFHTVRNHHARWLVRFIADVSNRNYPVSQCHLIPVPSEGPSYELRASMTAFGFLDATFSSAFAGPSGLLLPCSQF